MYKILISDKLGQSGLDRLDQMDDVIYDMKVKLSKEELISILPEYDGWIVRSGTKPDADMIAAGKNLKVIGRAGMGIDNIDVDAATMHGVIVMNTPGANSMATAEQTLALMLAVSRHTAPAHASLKDGQWNRSQYVGTELYEKTLGIVGFGRIGRLVAERALAFGMDVVAYDPFVSEEIGRNLGVTLVDLDDLYAQADYITLHTAAVAETINMINAESIAQMKDNVVIINAARGTLIDDQALADGLKAGKVKAAALDVFVKEPPEDNPLIGLDNVLHTPHLGASSQEAQRNVAIQMVEQVADALRGNGIRNAVNLPFEVGPDFDTIKPYLDLAEKIGALHAGLTDEPVTAVEIEASGQAVDGLVRAIASALLKGLLEANYEGTLNYINAPLVANQLGVSITQTMGNTPDDYPNMITAKVRWNSGERILAGVLFGGTEPRIVRMNDFLLDARPEGVLLVMKNKDVPGVIGQIGTILSAYQVNIGEWRMGRNKAGGEALSIINLDSRPNDQALDALKQVSAVTGLDIVML